MYGRGEWWWARLWRLHRPPCPGPEIAQEAGLAALPQTVTKEALLQDHCRLPALGGGGNHIALRKDSRTSGLGARWQGRKEMQKEEQKGVEVSGREGGGWTGTRWGLLGVSGEG